MEQFGTTPENLFEGRFTDPSDNPEPALEFTADALGTGAKAKGGKTTAAIDEEELAKPLADEKLTASLQSHLAAYQGKKPFREGAKK